MFDLIRSLFGSTVSLLASALLVVAMLLGGGWSTRVVAHEAMSGWRYPYQCCADNDCAELATSAVAETRSGYAVTVLPGTHPMWPHARADPLRLTVAYSDARPSPDGHFHLCLDHAGKLLCFFAAIGGS